MCYLIVPPIFICFFFTYPPATEIYTLSLHDALPIFGNSKYSSLDQINRDNVKNLRVAWRWKSENFGPRPQNNMEATDRKSTRLNSSHSQISYAVFCLKKKKKKTNLMHRE